MTDRLRPVARRARVAAALSCLGLAASAGLASTQAIVTNFDTLPNSLVPGQPGVRFLASPGTGVGTIFVRPRVSPDGSKWVLTTRRTILTGTGVQDTARDGLVVAGTPLGATTVVAVERDPWPGFTTGLVAGETRTGIFDADAAINDAGQVAFVTLTDAAGSSNRVIARASLSGPSLTLSSMEISVREGLASPAVGFNEGNSFQVGGLSGDGRIIYNSIVMTPAPPSGSKQATFLGTQVLAQTISGVNSAPNLPLGGTDGPYFVMGVFAGDPVAQVSDSGTGTLVFAQVSGGSDVAVLNGTSLVREGQVLPGDGFLDVLVSQVNNGRLAPGGQNVLLRGFSGNEGWVYGKRNGADVKFKTGSPITPGNAEQWLRFAIPPNLTTLADFTNVAINDAGDYVVTGFTNSTNLDRNVAMVQNGAVVLLREGDVIDITGDGVAAGDDAVILGFGQDTMTVTNDRFVYFIADVIRPAATAASVAIGGPIIQGQGLFRVKLACGPSDIAGPGPVSGHDGELTADDVIFFISAFTAGNLALADIAGPGPVAGGDGELTADDVILFIGRFTAGC